MNSDILDILTFESAKTTTHHLTEEKTSGSYWSQPRNSPTLIPIFTLFWTT